MFDQNYYLNRYPDVRNALSHGLPSAQWHYDNHGMREGRFRNQNDETLYNEILKTFDKEFYAKQNPDVIRFGLDPLYHYVTFGRYEGRYYSQSDKIKYLADNGGIFKPIYVTDDSEVIKFQNLSRAIITRIKQVIALNDLNFNTKLKEFVTKLNDLPNFYTQVDYANQSGYDKNSSEYLREREARCGSDNFNAFQTRARDNWFGCVDNDFNPNYAIKYWSRKAAELQYNWLKDKENILQNITTQNITEDTVEDSKELENQNKEQIKEGYKVNWLAVSILVVGIAVMSYIVYKNT